MAETKIIVNKHLREPSAITENVFSNKMSVNKYGEGKHEYLREGEIVICNNVNDPGLFIMTESANTENPGKVINITSGENIKLSSAYTESTASGEALKLTSADTVAQAFGKVSKQIKDALENAMPNTGEGLEIVTDPETGEKQLNVAFDHYTLLLKDGRLCVNTEIIEPGSGGTTYIPGYLIAIDPITHEISVTGVTPELYATDEDLQQAVLDAVLESKEYVDGKGFTTANEVAEAIAEAQIQAIEESKSYADDKLTEAKEYTDEQISGVSSAITSIEGQVASADTKIAELNEKVDNLDPSAIELVSSQVVTETEPFIGLDGKEHPAGIYLVLAFGKNGVPSSYSYSDIAELIHMGEAYMTAEEYEALGDDVDPNTTYYIYED